MAKEPKRIFDPETLSVLEVARRYGIHVHTVRRYVEAGWIPGFSIAPPGAVKENWRFRLADLERWERNRAASAGNEPWAGMFDAPPAKE